MTKENILFVELMEELGISDVSDVSDPPLSEDDSPLAKFKQAVSKKAANKQAQSDEESDWDSSRVSTKFSHTACQVDCFFSVFETISLMCTFQNNHNSSFLCKQHLLETRKMRNPHLSFFSKNTT